MFGHFPEFQVFKPFVPECTHCPYSEETYLKSEVATLPIQMKDEKKCDECVDVLDQLEEWTFQIYSDAGLCNVPLPPNAQPPVIETTSRPDQPASHIPPVNSSDDPLCGCKDSFVLGIRLPE